MDNIIGAIIIPPPSPKPPAITPTNIENKENFVIDFGDHYVSSGYLA